MGNSARNVHPQDNSPQATAARRINSFAELDGLEFLARVDKKHHQWLSDQGLARLETQIHAVTAIARSSTCYRDFDRRCEAAFAGGSLQLALLAEDFEEGA